MKYAILFLSMVILSLPLSAQQNRSCLEASPLTDKPVYNYLLPVPSPDSTMIAVHAHRLPWPDTLDSTVQIFDACTFDVIFNTSEHPELYVSSANRQSLDYVLWWSPDSRYIVLPVQTSRAPHFYPIFLFDMNTEQLRRFPSPQELNQAQEVIWSPESTQVAVIYRLEGSAGAPREQMGDNFVRGNRVVIFDAATLEPLYTSPDGLSQVSAVYTEQGWVMLSYDNDEGVLGVENIDSGEVLFERSDVYVLSFAAEGDDVLLAFAAAEDLDINTALGTIEAWNVSTQQRLFSGAEAAALLPGSDSIQNMQDLIGPTPVGPPLVRNTQFLSSNLFQLSFTEAWVATAMWQVDEGRFVYINQGLNLYAPQSMCRIRYHIHASGVGTSVGGLDIIDVASGGEVLRVLAESGTNIHKVSWLPDGGGVVLIDESQQIQLVPIEGCDSKDPRTWYRDDTSADDADTADD